MLFYKIGCVYKDAVIDNDFYKSSSSGQKMHLDTLNAIFIKLVAIEKIALIDNDFYKSSSSGQKKMHLDMLNAFL
jgi:hypothetical protein